LSFVDLTKPSELEAANQAQHPLVWVETPTIRCSSWSI